MFILKNVQRNHLNIFALLSVTKYVEIFSLISSVLNLGIYTIDDDTPFLFSIHRFIKIICIQYQVILVKSNIQLHIENTASISNTYLYIYIFHIDYKIG